MVKSGMCLHLTVMIQIPDKGESKVQTTLLLRQPTSLRSEREKTKSTPIFTKPHSGLQFSRDPGTKGKRTGCAVEVRCACCARAWFWWWSWSASCSVLECSRMGFTSSRIRSMTAKSVPMLPIVLSPPGPSWGSLRLLLFRVSLLLCSSTVEF